jgi:hypothetical protein
MPLAERAECLARIVQLLVQLKRLDVGRKLILEAADMAESFRAGNEWNVRVDVAQQLAPFDLVRANAIMRGAGVGDERSRLELLAMSMAAVDSPKALKLVEESPHGKRVEPLVRFVIARRLAKAGNASDAVKMADDGAEVTDLWWIKAVTYAEIAVAVGKTDKALATSLIDRSLDLFLKNPSRVFVGRPGLTARIAYQARMAGYADMQSVVARVLACRGGGIRGDAKTDATLAVLLSLTDREAAKWVSDQAWPPDRAVTSELQSDREWVRAWFFAVAMANPERGIAEIDRRIESIKRTRGSSHYTTELIDLLMILTQPPEADLFRELSGAVGEFWPQ